MVIQIEENKLWLEPISQKHAISLYEAVDQNREHLMAFLPWVVIMTSRHDMIRYTRNCERLAAQFAEKSFVIFWENRVAGRIGIHHIDLQNQSGSIGYWLIEEAQGHGII